MDGFAPPLIFYIMDFYIIIEYPNIGVFMELYFKKPSKEARKAMCEAANKVESKNKYIKSAENAVCNLTSHKYSKITNSGNSAILAAMSNFNGKILVPDQGGWSGFTGTWRACRPTTWKQATATSYSDPSRWKRWNG